MYYDTINVTQIVVGDKVRVYAAVDKLVKSVESFPTIRKVKLKFDDGSENVYCFSRSLLVGKIEC